MTGDRLLTIEELTCGYGQNEVLRDLGMEIRAGEIWCILGRNGVGKTTLFKTILGSLPKIGGRILLGGRDTQEMSRREIARMIAYVPQYHTPPFPFTVREVVVMGRNAYIGTFGAPSAEDERAADRVLKSLRIAHLADREYTQISGGERQMVLIARAMAQEPVLLMMDEPAANLDYGNQVKMLKKMRELAGAGISIVFTSHNPEHAFLCEANVAAIVDADTVLTGPAKELIDEDLLKRMYGIDACLLEGERPDGKSVRSVVPYL